MSDGLDHVFERITLRRAEVLRELADGRTDKEIAAKLGISVNGVRSHVEDLREITGMNHSRDIGRWWRDGAAASWANFLARKSALLSP
jgi:DNA-binding CsgD family transcriptional regulator